VRPCRAGRGGRRRARRVSGHAWRRGGVGGPVRARRPRPPSSAGAVGTGPWTRLAARPHLLAPSGPAAAGRPGSAGADRALLRRAVADTPGGVAVLVARCVSPALASFVGRCRRHRAVDAPGGAAPFSGPFGAGGRGAAGGPLARTGPSFVGPNGRPWRGGCSVRGPLARTGR